MVVAGFAKIDLVPLPLSVLVWCGIYYRAELRHWLLTGMTLTAVILAACILYFGPNFVSDVLFHPRSYSLTRLLIGAPKALSGLTLLVAGSIWLFLLAPRAPPERLILLWALFGGPLGVTFIGGGGVVFNVFFDLCIALCVVMGLLVTRLRQTPAHRYTLPLVVTAIAIQLLWRVPGRAKQLAVFLDHRAEQLHDGTRILGLSLPSLGRSPARCWHCASGPARLASSTLSTLARR